MALLVQVVTKLVSCVCCRQSAQSISDFRCLKTVEICWNMLKYFSMFQLVSTQTNNFNQECLSFWVRFADFASFVFAKYVEIEQNLVEVLLKSDWNMVEIRQNRQNTSKSMPTPVLDPHYNNLTTTSTYLYFDCFKFSSMYPYISPSSCLFFVVLKIEICWRNISRYVVINVLYMHVMI